MIQGGGELPCSPQVYACFDKRQIIVELKKNLFKILARDILNLFTNSQMYKLVTCLKIFNLDRSL